MAATPLFTTLGVLKAKLRMTNLPATGDVNAILDQAVSDTRLDFYRRLGVSRVAILVALSSTSTPTTEDEVLRSLAESVEAKSVRFNLMCVLPYAWKDQSGNINSQWNEEAPFRDMSGEEVRTEKARLAEQIEESFQVLAAEDVIGDESDMRVFDGTPTTGPPAPLDSIRRTTSTRLTDED